MTPSEWWLIYDAKSESSSKSNLTDDDIEELEEMLRNQNG